MLVYIPRCLFNYQSVIQTYRDYEELYSEEDKPRYYIYITDNNEKNYETPVDYMLNYMSIVYDRPITENYYEGQLYGNFTNKMISKYSMNPSLGIYLDKKRDRLSLLIEFQFFLSPCPKIPFIRKPLSTLSTPKKVAP